jgi:hypothetical protein
MPRRSLLEPHLDLLGKIPDQVLAERSGISLASVRAYRYRHRIKLEKSASLTARANIRSDETEIWAFLLTLSQDSGEIQVVASGKDIREVAETCLSILQRRYPQAVLRRIVALAPVLR